MKGRVALDFIVCLCSCEGVAGSSKVRVQCATARDELRVDPSVPRASPPALGKVRDFTLERAYMYMYMYIKGTGLPKMASSI